MGMEVRRLKLHLKLEGGIVLVKDGMELLLDSFPRLRGADSALLMCCLVPRFACKSLSCLTAPVHKKGSVIYQKNPSIFKMPFSKFKFFQSKIQLTTPHYNAWLYFFGIFTLLDPVSMLNPQIGIDRGVYARLIRRYNNLPCSSTLIRLHESSVQ